MAQEDQAPESVSTEAHKRVQMENENLKAKVAELEGVVVQAGVRERIVGVIAEKAPDAKLVDVDWAATMLTPHLSGSPEREQIAEALETQHKRILQTITAGTAPDGEAPVPAADVADTPGFAASPAGDGSPPVEAPRLDPRGPEVTRLLEANDMDAIRKLDKDNRIAWRTAAP